MHLQINGPSKYCHHIDAVMKFYCQGKLSRNSEPSNSDKNLFLMCLQLSYLKNYSLYRLVALTEDLNKKLIKSVSMRRL